MPWDSSRVIAKLDSLAFKFAMEASAYNKLLLF